MVAANEGELLRFFQVVVSDLRQFSWHGGKFGHIAVTDALIAFGMHDGAVLGAQLADRHAPFGRDSVHQDPPGLGTGNPQGFEITWDCHTGQ